MCGTEGTLLNSISILFFAESKLLESNVPKNNLESQILYLLPGFSELRSELVKKKGNLWSIRVEQEIILNIKK